MQHFGQLSKSVVSFIITFLIAAVICALPIYLSGFNPFATYEQFIIGGFGSLNNLISTLIKSTPIIFCSLAVVVAFRCGFWNIGAEGQLNIGALFAVVAGLYFKWLPIYIHLPLVFFCSSCGGAIWGYIAAHLKVRYNANEMIVTLLLNFIAFQLVSYMVRFPLRPESSFNPVTANIPESARLPLLIPNTSLHAGILIATVVTILVWIILKFTVIGYRIKAVGANASSSSFAGISVNKITKIGMIISGGLAGLAGMTEVSGVHYLLSENISFNYGYFGIPAALIGKLNPFGAFVASIFIGSLLNGGRYAQFMIGVPYTVVYLMVAVFILSILLEFFVESRILSKIRSS